MQQLTALVVLEYAAISEWRMGMGKNPKDKCPVCKKSIQADRSHFERSGVAASPSTKLRCVLYEMHILAASALALNTTWKEEVTFHHPKLGTFTPSKSLEIAALVSFRSLHEFLYNPKCGEDFSIGDFGRTCPKSPKFDGFKRGEMFTKESINKYVVHLTWTRINKPRCIPQPKFGRAPRATIKNARKLLEDAKRFVDDVCNQAKPDAILLDEDGSGYRKIFEEAFARLESLKV